MANRPQRGLATLIVVALLAVAAAAPGPALAQPAPAPAQPPPSAAELAAARQIFVDALRAEDEGRWREALDGFVRVAQITASPQVRFHVGVCHEHLGELVEALNAFELAVQEGEQRRTADVVSEARAHAEKLRPQIGKLLVRAPADAADLAVTIDGRPINAALAGAAMLINPGARRVTVQASNYAGSVDTTLTVGAGESRTLDASLGEKKSAAPPPPPPPPPRVEPPPPVPRPPLPEPKRNPVPIYVAGGVTAALAVGALATGIAAHVEYTQYIRENVTPPTEPLPEREALRSEGMARAWASTALTIGAAVGGAATIYLLVRPVGEPPHPPAALAWSPWIGPGGAGLGLRGAL